MWSFRVAQLAPREAGAARCVAITGDGHDDYDGHECYEEECFAW